MMKGLFTTAAAFFVCSASSGLGGLAVMGNMLMGNSLDDYLSELVSYDSLTVSQMDDILSIADNTTSHDRFDMFETEESKDQLRTYLYAEVSASNMDDYTAEMIASITSLGALYPTEQLDLLGFEGPAAKNYDDNGNLEFLGRIQPRATGNGNFYVGIWGLTKGSREYALLCSAWGLEIIDVTNPSEPFRVQSVQMSGGLPWRDVATHTAADGKVYAYVAAQDSQDRDSNLFVFDLSNLSGDTPNGVDSDPIPSGANGYLDRGQSGFGHTVNVAGGFLFLNGASQSIGCRVYDLSNPMSPQFIFSHGGKGQQCHDSSLRENVNVGGQLKTVWIVSEGTGLKETLLDFTAVKTTKSAPPVISTTPQQNGIYAHSSVLSVDNRFLFQCDENNKGDIYVYDVSDMTQPTLINIFQYSEENSSNAIPHNSFTRGGYLYVAYYEAGLRAFDISNPYAIREVGKIETYRDPNQDGSFEREIGKVYRGAWNTFTELKSGNILVTDMLGGLFIVKANAPYSEPSKPILSVERTADDDASLTWSNASPNVRAYSVERSIGGQPYVVVAEFLTATAFFDGSVRGKTVSYKVKALNGEGTGVSDVFESVSQTPSPTNAPTNEPTPMPSVPPTSDPTSPPSEAPTPQPSPGPTPLPSNSPTPFPTTASPTRDVSYRGADGCIREGETQVEECLDPVIPNANGRAVNCCLDTVAGGLECDRPECFSTASFFEATAHCEKYGMRLCSVQELESGVCCREGCNFDFRVGWTTDICSDTLPQEPTLPPTSASTPPPTLSSTLAPTAPPTPLPTLAPTPPPTTPPTSAPTTDTAELPTSMIPTFVATAGFQMAEPV